MPTAGMPSVADGDVPHSTPGAEAVFVARATHEGMFKGADDFHFGRGKAQLIVTAPGVYTLRFEDFSVRNGPDLFVYLTPDATSPSGFIALNPIYTQFPGGYTPSFGATIEDYEGVFGAHFPEGVDMLKFAAHGVIKDMDRLQRLFELFAHTLHRLCHMGSAYEDDPRVKL